MFYMTGRRVLAECCIVGVVFVLAAVHPAIISHEYWLGMRKCFMLKGSP